MRIKAVLIEMASSEIMSIIDPKMYQVIKKQNPKPHFKAFVVGHEGESSGRVGIGGEFFSVVKKWYRSAIEKMHEKIRLGINLFKGHGLDNDPGGRVRIGEVVGKALQEIKGILSEIIIAYIYPEFQDQELDVASIEADIYLQEDGGEYSAEVENVSGIALGNSKTEVPGFAGATLLGMVQEFTDNKDISRRNEEMTIETISDLQGIIKANKWHPSDVFSTDEILGDPAVESHVEEAVRSGTKEEYGHRMRKESKYEKEKEDWEKEKEALEKEIKSLKVETTKSQVGDLFEEEKKDRKLDEKETKFIEKRLKDFEPEDPEMIKKEFSKFLDSKIDDFNDLQEEFGVKKKKEKDPKKDPNEEESEEEEEEEEEESGDDGEDPLKGNPHLPGN